MRSKIGITFFRNGNVNIYDATLSEELWHDYKAFAQLAAVKKQKDTRQGNGRPEDMKEPRRFLYMPFSRLF